MCPGGWVSKGGEAWFVSKGLLVLPSFEVIGVLEICQLLAEFLE